MKADTQKEKCSLGCLEEGRREDDCERTNDTKNKF